MSDMVPAGKPSRPRAMVFVPGSVAATGVVEVYRHPNGHGVVVIGQTTAVKQTPFGAVRVRGGGAVEFPTHAAYNDAKKKAFLKNPTLYAAAVGALGIHDNVDDAPMLPEHLLSKFADTSNLLLPAVTTQEASMPLLGEHVAQFASNDAEVRVAGVEVEEESEESKLERERDRMADLLMGGGANR